MREKGFQTTVFLSVLILIFNLVSVRTSGAQVTVQKSLNDEYNRLIQISQKYVVGIVAQVGEEYLKNQSLSVQAPLKKIASGCIIDSSGIVITSSSVIQNISRISVILYNGERRDASLIGIDNNFAILHIRNLPFANPQFAQMNSERIGNFVLIIGNSLKYLPDVWIGQVRTVYENGMLQIAAKILPGSIGAPVFNLRGQMVGVLTAKLIQGKRMQKADDLTVEDDGVVISMTQLLPGVKHLLDQTRTGVAWIGMTVTGYPRGNRNVFYKVSQISTNSPAEKAGIRLGDEILAFNNEPIHDLIKIQNLIKSMPVSQRVEFRIRRGDSTFAIPIQLDRKPALYAAGSISKVRKPQKSMAGLAKYPSSQVTRLLMQKRLSQIDMQIQLLKKQMFNKIP